MTRSREIPSVLYRSQNLVNMTFPVLEGVPKIRVVGAARLNDAYGPGAGVISAPAPGWIPMFEVLSGLTYKSPSVKSKNIPLEDTNRRLTRMLFDPDDFATPAQPLGVGSYLPTDDQTLFIRIQTWNPATNAWNPPGPIMVIVPYDFFTTKEPVFTLTGQAPNMDIGPWPPAIPDFMPPSVLNFLVPAYSTTVSLVNLDPGDPLFASFHPGMPPTVIPPRDNVALTGSGVPEFFIGSPDANPWFTLRIAVVNSA